MSPDAIDIVPLEALLERVKEKRDRGCRLVQISAARLPEGVEVTYSFDLKNRLSNVRVLLPDDGTRLPSISAIFGCAVLYENEIQDLFGVGIDGLALDFKGKFYRTTVRFPFGSTKAPAPPPAPPAATAAAGPPQNTN
ncbi:MAG TPA: NADH-quinone oxidoreductase subunit C [Verrucomicrobia bacterium]|nr:NADH-quinone oxidoreductase subunit C [Verrucomicrobiota bacterium]HOP96145.1 NADH-quinone oxidoreductase subunit C [Verrucomicrobiota bacterium]HPU56496.1 NADH-quinone oxidoreductase subunit C [Verrucomicrobiota bacterium]